MPPIWPSCDATLMIFPRSRSSIPGSDESGAQEHSAQVDPKHPVPLGDVELGEGALADRAGVVDEDVDLAELGQGGIDHGAHLLLVADIGLDQQRALSRCSDRRQHRRRHIGIEQIGDHDVGALGGERHRDLAADPARATGDDRGLSVELAGHAMSLDSCHR